MAARAMRARSGFSIHAALSICISDVVAWRSVEKMIRADTFAVIAVVTRIVFRPLPVMQVE